MINKRLNDIGHELRLQHRDVWSYQGVGDFAEVADESVDIYDKTGRYGEARPHHGAEVCSFAAYFIQVGERDIS